MSTVGQPKPEPAWKQEVNRRLAAHKNRKGAPAASESKAAVDGGNSRAAEAAARVAARYAKAPTYSQMQAEEARIAVRAAEIATQVALEAQAAAETALAELHAAATETPRGPAVIESIVRPAPVEPAPMLWAEESAIEERSVSVIEPLREEAVAVAEPEPEPAPIPVLREGETFGVRWEPDLPVRTVQMPPPAPRAQEDFELSAEDWWTPAQVEQTLHAEPIAIEAQQTHANLIEFPRELVATRKMRPRLAEASATPAAGQLSIFEVDPGAISTEPGTEEHAAATWTGPEWSGIELDEHPEREIARESAPVNGLNKPALAPFSRRMLAWVVDCSLVLAAFFGLAILAVDRLNQIPPIKTAEILAAIGVAITGLLYHVLFFRIGNGSTPGMRYANLGFCTFDNELPTHDQLRRRLVVMLLSFAPVGLGMVWSLFDEDHLTWHDRISGTYIRKRF